jgi:hypothetical protein
MGINNFPSINPPLPCPVDIGESQRWLYELRNVAALIGRLRKVRGQITAVIGEASLGSGEIIESAELPIELLGPLLDWGSSQTRTAAKLLSADRQGAVGPGEVRGTMTCRLTEGLSLPMPPGEY